MKIYTKTGDKGETGLFGGSRVKKASLRVSAYGAVDQANAALGVAANFMETEILIKVIRVIQDKLFVLGGELASDEEGRRKLKIRIGKADIAFLEGVIDEITKDLPEKTWFVIPGMTKGSAFLHGARTQVRFAEREILTLGEEEEVSEEILQYMNRLSDTLYAMSRYEDEGTKKAEESFSAEALSDTLAEEILRKAEKKAKELGIPMVLSVVDDGGCLKAMKRMDGAIKGSVAISRDKALTAVYFQTATENLGKETLPGASLYGLEQTNGGHVVTFAGGMPIYSKGRLLGALGVSGGTVEEDKAVCLAGLTSMKD